MLLRFNLSPKILSEAFVEVQVIVDAQSWNVSEKQRVSPVLTNSSDLDTSVFSESAATFSDFVEK